MDKKIILASNSPRRREILGNFLKFDVESRNVKEVYDNNKEPHINAMAIAFEKALAVAEDNKEKIVIGADTIVYKDKALGKPKNKEDAKSMLVQLSGVEHSVITGVSIICLNENYKRTFYNLTKVKFKNLESKEIDEYLKNSEYKDKAGSYAIQGYGAVFIDYIYGDFFNVVGLPIGDLLRQLKKDFNIDFYGEDYAK